MPIVARYAVAILGLVVLGSILIVGTRKLQTPATTDVVTVKSSPKTSSNPVVAVNPTMQPTADPDAATKAVLNSGIESPSDVEIGNPDASPTPTTTDTAGTDQALITQE